MKKYFSPKEVARLAGVPGGRLRYWTRLGLVPHLRPKQRRLRFEFQGLVAARTIKALREQGVSLHRIRACVEKLKKRHPDIAEPLSEVRFFAARHRLVLALKRRRFTPEGQLHLEFPEAGSQVIDLGGPDIPALFRQALDCERRGAWKEAWEKYLAILSLKPDHPDSLVNLGNILYRWGFAQGAEAHYRQALKADPGHAVANFNLANLLEEKGLLGEAAQLYQRALDADPEFVEACYNLARTLEKQGNRKLARQYWLAYLELEPSGEMADFLRRHLADEPDGTTTLDKS